MKIKLLIPFLVLGSCASNPYPKTMIAVGAGVGAGAIYGNSKPEYKSQNSMMYGAVGGLIAGIAALSIDIDNNDPDKLRTEKESLKRRLDDFQKSLEPKLVSSGTSLFAAPLPKEVSNLIEPGEWKRYKMDQWVQDSSQPNIWYRQIEMFEIIPPTTR